MPSIFSDNSIGSNGATRISVSWTLSFLYRFSFMLGWTVIVAIFVNRVGIESLPYLLIANALLVMIGTVFFSEVVRFVKKEHLIAISLICAAILLILSITVFLPTNEILFLISAITGISLFFSQTYILLQLFIEEQFTPLESERAFPLIETAEIAGAIAAGAVLTALAHHIAPYKFLFVIVMSSLLLIPIISAFSSKMHIDLSNLKLEKKKNIKDMRKLQRIEEGWEAVKKTGFLQGVLVIILCQFIIFNLVEFQYTKAIQQDILNAYEETLVQQPELMMASTGIEDFDPHVINSMYEKELTFRLGFFQMIFSAIALVTQIFLSAPIMKRIGVLQSLLLHPILMIVNFSFLTMRFNIQTAAISKGGFEMTKAIFHNSYLTSYYSIKEEMRDEIKEFMEGIVVPLGAIIGTGFILLFEHILHGSKTTLALNITMLTFALLMAFVIMGLKHEYTKLSEETINHIENTADKLNAIEVLGQRGHTHAAQILGQVITNPIQRTVVKINAIKTLGKIKNAESIPFLLTALEDKNPAVQRSAVEALCKFRDIDKHVYKNAFGRHRISIALKKLFLKKGDINIKTDIVKILTKINERDAVQFLLEQLEGGNESIKEDCVEVMYLFNDPNSAHFIEPFLDSENTYLKCRAMHALWRFPKYKKQVANEIKRMFKLGKKSSYLLPELIRLIGENKMLEYKSKITELTHSKKADVRNAAYIALVQLGEGEYLEQIIAHVMKGSIEKNKLNGILNDPNISARHKKRLRLQLNKRIGEEINKLLLKNNALSLEDTSINDLKNLRFFYDLLNREREKIKIAGVIEKCIKELKKQKKIA